MGSWPQYPLSSFVDSERSISYGIVQPGKLTAHGVPIVRVNNFKDGHIDARDALLIDPEVEEKYERSRLQGGEILLTPVGTMGLCAVVPNELSGWNVARAVGVVPLKKDVDKRWITYVLRSQPSQDFIETHANTTVQPTFNLRDLARLPIPMPPDTVRVPASELLSALDDKIELNRRMNETLEAMARAIFKDWFVDFGPTRAKAEGRAPYLASELWELFPDALDDEGKPVGWKLAPLSALAEVSPESWSKKNAPAEIAYVDLANTKWGSIDVVQHFLWRDAPSRAKRVLRSGDTIVGLVRPGNGSYAFIGTPGLTGSTGFAVLRPREPQNTELVFLSATAPENIERLAHLADGAAYPAVRPEAVEATEVAIASNSATTSFSALVAPIIDHMESNKVESQTLAQTRDLLVPKLMSGEIRLCEAEQAVEAVA